MLYLGAVEDLNDPLQAGRARVRVFGIHSLDKGELPTNMLAWSSVMMPSTSPASAGIGSTPYLTDGCWVVLYFLDECKQESIILGTVLGKGDLHANASGDKYLKNRVIASGSGHRIELDDSSGSESVLIRHKSGSSISMSASGDINITSRGNLNISAGANVSISGTRIDLN